MIVLLMGASGAGKTAVGERLANRLGWAFLDADDLHPPENLRKMKAGVPLTDDDRLPWLRKVREAMGAQARSGGSALVACSALKRCYRTLLLKGLDDVRLVYLRASRSVLEHRLRERHGHFFDPELLDSQLETLEEPAEALVVDADEDVENVVESIAAALGLSIS